MEKNGLVWDWRAAVLWLENIIEDYVFQPKAGQARQSFCFDFMSAAITRPQG
jgi:hypothetical protein